MGLIPEEYKQQLKENFEKNLKGEVRILVLTQENECPLCKQSRELAEEVGAARAGALVCCGQNMTLLQ